MRYKVISSAIAVLLLATPVFSQVLVETPKTTNPTTVITGQPFTQTYVIRFLDLSASSEEIIIKKEDLEQKTFKGGLEVIDFKIEYETKSGQIVEHWWFLTYTLRVIDPKKGPKVIPSFVVPWKHKKAGQQENDPTIQYNYNLKTEEVHLNYVSTIPEKDPSITIRDLIDFGNFKTISLVLKSSSWFLAVVPMGLWLRFFVRRLRSSGAASREEESKNVQTDEPMSKVVRVSKRKALRNLRKVIRKFKKTIDSGYNDLMHETSVALNIFLRVRVGLSVGTTPSEMVQAISDSKKLGSLRKPLLALAEKACEYQNHVEGGFQELYTEREAYVLRKLLGDLRWYRRLFRRR